MKNFLLSIASIFSKSADSENNDKAISVENENTVETYMEEETEDDDKELVAILTAAIAAFNESIIVSSELATTEEISGFRIVSFKERKKLV